MVIRSFVGPGKVTAHVVSLNISFIFKVQQELCVAYKHCHLKHFHLNIFGEVGDVYTSLHSLTQSLQFPSPGRKFYTGRLRPEVQTLTLTYTNFSQNGTPFIHLEQNCTLFLYCNSRISQKNRISYNRHVLLTLSVVLIHLLKGCKLLCVSRCYFCQNLAPFGLLRFSHHFYYFAADFVTLSYTKMAIFPTL